MTNHSTIDESLPLPITQKAIRSARQFASEQCHPQKKEQVYLNTLAVLAVRNYLKILDIETDLSQCDSWNPAIRLFEDVADLYVKGLGKVECRPIRYAHLSAENGKGNTLPTLPHSCPVPIEVREERICYLVVAIDEEEKEARLLGFSPTADSGKLVLNDLHSLDDFLIHLEGLSESKINLRQWLANLFTTEWEACEAVFNPKPEPDSEPIEPVNPIPSKLGNWVKNIWENGWQKIEQGKQDLTNVIVPETPPAMVFRSGGTSTAESSLSEDISSIKIFPEADVTRAKLIDLGMRLGRTKVALLVAVAEQSDRTFRVHVQLHPTIGDRYLPRNIKLALISDTGEILDEVKSRIQDICILLHDFYVEPNESFSIKIEIDDLSIIENFVV
jgi:hypothetical protein